MTNPLDLDLSAVTETAIRALSERTDPLIARVNEGGVLTNAESKQVFFDLYKMTAIMKASGEAMQECMTEIKLLDEEIAQKAKEIALMKVLLGLNDTEKQEK